MRSVEEKMRRQRLRQRASSERCGDFGAVIRRVAPFDCSQVLELVEEHCRTRAATTHGSVNAATAVRASRDPEFRNALLGCTMLSADGQAVVWAARLLGHRLPARVAGIDLMLAIIERAASQSWGIFLLGARPVVLGALQDRLLREQPSLVIRGSHHGYFRSGKEEADLIQEIAAAAPDVLFVALGSPKTELFLRRHAKTLAVPFAMVVGGSFDVIGGRLRRAPVIVQRFGLEWLYRLLQEPRRLWRRYLIGNTLFLYLLARELALRARSN